MPSSVLKQSWQVLPGRASGPWKPAALRALKADTLAGAVGSSSILPIQPVLDGWVLPRPVDSALARGAVNLVPVIVGSNADESDEIFYQVAKKYPDVKTDRILVDAMTTRMVLKPASLDTIVASNLHADILSDLAAALSGSLGIAPTANLNPERKFPSMFEPIHGSAFDITGKGIANPIATFWTAAMMLEHLGEPKAAARLMKAIERTTEEQVFTPDLGGVHDTRAVTNAVKRAL